MTEEVDLEAFLAGEPEVVTRTRQQLLTATANHEWPSPEVQERVTADLLTLVATVPHRGDDEAYMMEAWELACTHMSPLVMEHRALVALRRKFEEMKPHGTIQ